MTENMENAKEVLRILIVDDVEANRFVLRDIIVEMGYQPILTANGVQALKILERHRPHLIILDIAMPEMDGYEFCQIMKANPDTREIPIIFISAFDDPADVVKGFNLGGEDYITKPFIPEVVKARVSLHLKLYEASQKMQQLNRQLQASITAQLDQMENEKRNVLYALTSVARENACYDELHMERLKYNCRILTEAMQLSPQYDSVISDTYIETMELAAPLCDLGNVAIPINLLQKKEALTKEEMEIMKTHTIVGTKILKDINPEENNDFVKMSIEIANYHHENWDGTGYPEGKKENEIPLPAQIIAVASDYCALTEHRTYREAYDKEEALGIMEQDVGRKYNPEIFQILRRIAKQLH